MVRGRRLERERVPWNGSVDLASEANVTVISKGDPN